MVPLNLPMLRHYKQPWSKHFGHCNFANHFVFRIYPLEYCVFCFDEPSCAAVIYKYNLFAEVLYFLLLNCLRNFHQHRRILQNLSVRFWSFSSSQISNKSTFSLEISCSAPSSLPTTGPVPLWRPTRSIMLEHNYFCFYFSTSVCISQLVFPADF